MEIKASARLTMKSIEREVDNSKIIQLLQEAYDMISELVDRIDELETENETLQNTIKDLESVSDG